MTFFTSRSAIVMTDTPECEIANSLLPGDQEVSSMPDPRTNRSIDLVVESHTNTNFWLPPANGLRLTIAG